MRPIILGMNSPYSTDPAEALSPLEPRSAGAHLLEILQIERPDIDMGDYLPIFDRRNLLNTLEWKPAEARRMAAELVEALSSETRAPTVVILGRELRDMLRVPPEWPWILRKDMGTWIARCLPHPSGRCRWYNDPTCRQSAAMLLAELAEDSLAEIRAEEFAAGQLQAE